VIERRKLLLGAGAAALAGLTGLYRARARPRAAPQAILRTSFEGCAIDVVRADLGSHRIALHWRRPDGKPFDDLASLHRFLAERGERPIAITNAGIFGDEAPIGLHVEGGRTLHPINLRDGPGNFYMKPNGVFLLDDAGARIVESSRYDGRGVRLATQSGPLLLDGGRVHPAFAPRSRHALIRSGVGVRSPREVLFAVSRDAITFHAFARFFADALACRDALYLDGTISRLYAPSAGLTGDGWFKGMLAVLAGADHSVVR
jgi:uncharacterized protein YigE (DUF2233 family)